MTSGGGLASTPVRPSTLLPLLVRYPNKATVTYLYLGFAVGFCIPYMGPQFATDGINLKSARELPDVVAKTRGKECTDGRLDGPFSCPTFFKPVGFAIGCHS